MPEFGVRGSDNGRLDALFGPAAKAMIYLAETVDITRKKEETCMKSMTGFGHYEYSNDYFIITTEIKAYNNRYLDVSFSAPSYLSFYEMTALEKVKNSVNRGHLDVSVKVKNLKDVFVVGVDECVVRSYAEAAKRILSICREEGLDFSINFSDIFSSDGVLRQDAENAEEKYREALDYSLSECLRELCAFKEREGESTKRDLEEKIGGIEDSLKKVEARAGELESMIKDNLRARITEMGLDSSYDESRILTEVAVMLVRYTINEEIVRLGEHIREFKKLLESREPVGKKMDFLCQEMNREINTIGSKSQIAEINLEVVKMKDDLENIREEIRNIE